MKEVEHDANLRGGKSEGGGEGACGSGAAARSSAGLEAARPERRLGWGGAGRAMARVNATAEGRGGAAGDSRLGWPGAAARDGARGGSAEPRLKGARRGRRQDEEGSRGGLGRLGRTTAWRGQCRPPRGAGRAGGGAASSGRAPVGAARLGRKEVKTASARPRWCRPDSGMEGATTASGPSGKYQWTHGSVR
uniref:Uncharacterized protein n=1 Tax=Oryza minuta TaxID=63629 RepID=A0A1V1H5Q6_ORYMI|nr:hypothetical protein [Oryza minuta]BAX24985.1 hypothetical protein [Oryza minuta]